jgi:hypothetical protein
VVRQLLLLLPACCAAYTELPNHAAVQHTVRQRLQDKQCTSCAKLVLVCHAQGLACCCTAHCAAAPAGQAVHQLCQVSTSLSCPRSCVLKYSTLCGSACRTSSAPGVPSW